MVAMLALPWDLAARASVSVLAQDEAGNTVTRGVPAEIKAKRFPTDTIELKEEFLQQKVAELLPEKANAGPAELDSRLSPDQPRPAQGRGADQARARRPQPAPSALGGRLRAAAQYQGLLELRGDALLPLQGQEVDVQVHLGFDLASSRHSRCPPPTRAWWSSPGPLTIYGTTVVLDHGWGLQTLYAHLSSLAVKEGDTVEKGQELGRTGTTGLAVGDHLHYEVLIHGIPVTPLEWWDARWIRDHIGRPLRDAGLPGDDGRRAPASEDDERAAARRRRGGRSR